MAFDADAASTAGARSSDRAGSMLGWQPLLPPLAAAINFGAGNTPLADGTPVAARLGLGWGSASRLRARVGLELRGWVLFERGLARNRR